MKAQRKQDYLVKIRNSMLWRFSWKEIHLTLEDLDLLFNSGKEEGKSEEELCNEFGNPKEFVNNLYLEHKRSGFVSKFPLNIIGFLAIALIVLSVFIYYYNNSYISIIYNCIPAIILPLFLWYLLGGNSMSRIHMNSNLHKKIYLIILSSSLIIMIMFQISEAIIVKNYQNIRSFAQLTQFIINSIIFIAIIIFFISL